MDIKGKMNKIRVRVYMMEDLKSVNHKGAPTDIAMVKLCHLPDNLLELERLGVDYVYIFDGVSYRKLIERRTLSIRPSNLLGTSVPVAGGKLTWVAGSKGLIKEVYCSHCNQIELFGKCSNPYCEFCEIHLI